MRRFVFNAIAGLILGLIGGGLVCMYLQSIV
jgi:hypothetical protein